jgi:hypothetical protein
MREREIGASEWRRFLDSFSRQHEGWLVTVEEMTQAANGSGVEARELPLQGVFMNPNEPSISIAVGRAADDHLTHTISRPARVIVQQSDTGADHGLKIDRQAGPSTQIRFRAAARPDEVDGITGR